MRDGISSNWRDFVQLLPALLCPALLISALAATASAQDEVPIPEPDITYSGEVPAGSQVAIENAAGPLASISAGDGTYVLAVRMVQAVTDPAPALPPAGTAYIGDTATFLIDGVAQGQVVLEERGALYRLDFPNPVTTPSPDTVLDPTRVIPDINAPTPTPTTGSPATATPTPDDNTPGVTATPTATPTPEEIGCVGDCNGDGRVAVNELITGVNIALGLAPVDQCPSFDANMSSTVSVNELIIAVNNALNGCPEAM